MAKPNEKNQTEQTNTQSQPVEQNDLQKQRQSSRHPSRYNSPNLSSLFSLSPRDFFTTNPFELMRRFASEMDRSFGSWQGQGSSQAALWSPRVEVFERSGNMIVRAELPGLDKDDVKIELSDNELIIHGERKSEHEEKSEGFYQSELSYGSFYRSIPLANDVNVEQVQAQFNNGVLEVTIPVPERKRRQIPIGETAKQAQAASGSTSKS
jgi:HSP20 family protein